VTQNVGKLFHGFRKNHVAVPEKTEIILMLLSPKNVTIVVFKTGFLVLLKVNFG